MRKTHLKNLRTAIMVVALCLTISGCGEDDPWVGHVVTVNELRESLDRSQLRIKYVDVATVGKQQAVLAGTAESPNGQKAAFEIEVYPSASDVTLDRLSYLLRFEELFSYRGDPLGGALENIAYGRHRMSKWRKGIDQTTEVEVMLDDAVFGAFPSDDPNVNPTLTSPFDK